MINRISLFADETELFKQPYEPKAGEEVRLILRALTNDVVNAYCNLNGTTYDMKKDYTDGKFDYFTFYFTCPAGVVSYYFIAEDEDDRVCFNRLGAVENSQHEYEFSFIADTHTPTWARGAVYYQIFCDRFCNGDPTNDVTDNEYYYTGGHVRHVTDWNKIPDELDVHNFYGGDLQGVYKKLDYLQSLGIEVIYFNPLFVSPSNHKYDAQDYDHIDPHFAVISEDEGTHMPDWVKNNQEAPRYIKRVTSSKNLQLSDNYFADFVKEAHRRGIKVVLDGVFNHCGSFNRWMDKEGIYAQSKDFAPGAYQSTKSPYRDYFNFKQNVAHAGYEGWWDYETLPKLNYEGSDQLWQDVLRIGAKWVSAPYNVDGWRLDVAADLGHSEQVNHKFWQAFHQKVRSANPEAIIFAEHYGNAKPWFNGKEWDTVMNYDAFMEPVSWFLTGMDKHSRTFDESKLGDGSLFFNTMWETMARFPRPALESALNQLSNHDHSRFMTRTNHTPGTLAKNGAEQAGQNVDGHIMRLGVMMQMTWVGAPGIYYGDEAGQVGWTDPDNRRTYPWGNEDFNLIQYHRALVKLRQTYPCLRQGSLVQVDKGRGYVAYARFDKQDCMLVIINSSDEAMDLSIPVWQLGIEREDTISIVFSSMSGDERDLKVKFGRMFVTVPARTGYICHYAYPQPRIRYFDKED